MMKHVAVIGGGLAGASAASWLVKHGYKVTIIERNNHLGGRIHTEFVSGVAVEMGAGFMTSAYKNLQAFLADNDLDIYLHHQHGKSGLLRSNQTTMVTTRNVVGSDLLSWRAKGAAMSLLLRIGVAWPSLDLHGFSKAARYDYRSVADMFSGQGGTELMEHALQPILNGYFYWTPDHTSEAMMLILYKAAFSHKTYKMTNGLQQKYRKKQPKAAPSY
jgi:oxygen-dependent protoporphyrinogen oxidase